MRTWLAQFEEALCRRDFTKIKTLFHEDSYWRDLVSFTWNIKTFEGRNQIVTMLKEVLSRINPHSWQMAGEIHQEGKAVAGFFTFETALKRGEGYLRLVDGKCWTLLTSTSALKGYEEKALEVDEKEIQDREKNITTPYCIIIGGGQCGIALGARLKQLHVPTIILDKNARPGDSWRSRYHALTLHDPVWRHHLPYIPFPKDWPIFPHKDQLGDWLEAYVHRMRLNYWSSTECINAEYLEDRETWKVLVNRDGQHTTLYSQQLVLATGMSGLPFTPKFPGADNFKGQQYHSTHYKSAVPYAQKKCIVLGSSTSAHDICADLYKHGSHVTMVQPSSSSVVQLNTLMECSFKNYSDAGMTTHQADLLGASTPYKVKTAQGISLYHKIKQKDSVFYEQLIKAGFLLDFGEDESGLSMKYHRRGSGYYFNVGASELIIEGKIKLKSGNNISLIKENAVVFTDGSELPADLIVYATGFSSMEHWIAKFISPEVARKIGPCWGIGSDTKKDPGPWEGELRNMWKPTKQKNLWIHGGNLAQSRFYSSLLALQIKARMEGLPTPVYDKNLTSC
jgi:putative flavoprotein involved in K+ transport